MFPTNVIRLYKKNFNVFGKVEYLREIVVIPQFESVLMQCCTSTILANLKRLFNIQHITVVVAMKHNFNGYLC